MKDLEMAGEVLQDLEDLMCPLAARAFYRTYEPHEVLGRGASSVVRRVLHRETGQEFATKIIDVSTEKLSSHQVEELRTSTQREVDMLRLCDGQKHIIKLHDVFITDIFIFLVFELCPKGELFDYLTSIVRCCEKRTRLLMKQILNSVSFMHNLNIVHRDLKPENILLDTDLNVKVSDFGFATTAESDTELTELCGTPGYLAPEVLVVSMYDNRPGYGKPVDMWACGVIMYTLLVGSPPFWHRKQMQMLRQIMSGRYSTTSPYWNEVSDEAKDLIEKLLVLDPADRLTAQQALNHKFFHIEGEEDSTPVILEAKEKEIAKFNGKQKFRALLLATLFLVRVKRLHMNPPPLSPENVRSQPYAMQQLRKAIDASAFTVYKHWVKRGENQNRAAMFESTFKGKNNRDRLASSIAVEPVTYRGLPLK